MARSSNNVVAKQTRKSEPSVRQSELPGAPGNGNVLQTEREVQKYEQAKELLRIPTIPAKSFAFELGCSERFVQQMAGMERKVPGYMVDKIIKVGSDLVWEQKKAIDSHIESLLLFKFGTTEDE